MEIKHPNYYKNLRKLARLRNRDQAISESKTVDIGDSVRLGPASSNVTQQEVYQVKLTSQSQATSSKLQATSAKLQAPSLKLQAFKK